MQIASTKPFAYCVQLLLAVCTVLYYVCVCVFKWLFEPLFIHCRWQSAVSSTSAFVYISGVSANSPPQLLEDINNLAVNEDTPVGNVLFTVNATDPEGSPVHYGILDTDRLGVDQDTGEVRVIQPLDREVSPSNIILCIYRKNDKHKISLWQINCT